ncbi:MAG: LXG domain-containing protein [Coprococcus phoceensis]
MGYHVKIEELLEIQSQMLNQLSEWGTQLATVYQALETIVVTPCIQGETGKSIQNYIQEVHIPVIGSLQQLLTEFQVRLSVYAEGYYGIDSSYEAEIPQEILEEQQQVLEKGREDFENLREEINSIISNVSDIVSVVQPSGLSLVLSYQLMESRVKTLNSDIGDYEETHQNDTQNMNSMLESIRSILIARTGSPAVSVTNYQAGSIAMLPAYQRLQMDYEASGNYVDQNIAQYEAAMKKFEDKMNDKLADDRKAEGLKQLLAGIVSATVGTALILATAGTAAPIVFFSATVVGGTSTLYGLSNATEGMNNISLGFSGDGFTMAENPIRDTLFAGNPELYYTIGNASTMISAMALPLSGILKGTTGAAKFKTIAVDGGRILIGNVAEDKAYDVIYQSTDSRILAMLGSNVVEGVLSGNPANSSVSEIGDVARKVDIEELSHTTIFKNSDDIALGEKVLSNVEVNKLDDVAEVVESGSKADVLAQNRANGRVFEQQEFAKFSSKNNNAVEQITVKTSSGVRTRVDAIGLDANGNVVINEFKSSLAAPLTNNQKIAFPEIFESGATVVGKGKGIFTGGYQIPSGTKVTIIRPE